MHIRKTVGVVSAVALLVPAALAFAEEGRPVGAPPAPQKMERGEEGRGERTIAQGARVGSTSPERDKEFRKAEEERMKVANRLGDIKDTTKQQMAMQMATQYDRLNKQWTDRFSAQLDQYGNILDRIEKRAATDSAAGKNVSSTTAAVAKARTTISAARAAVTAQAAKTYALSSASIPSTATSTTSGQEKIMQAIRKSFQALNKQLFADLKALRDGKMQDARLAVRDAIKTLGGRVMEMDEREASSTPSTNR